MLPALFSEAGVHSPSLPCPVLWIDTQAGESGLSVLDLPPGAIGKLFERQVSDVSYCLFLNKERECTQ